MRKAILFVITFILTLSFAIVANAEETNIKIYLEGKEQIIRPEQGIPYINVSTLNPIGRIIIPLDFVSESLGHKVEWNEVAQTAIIDSKYKIKIGKRLIESKDINYGFGYEPIIKDGKVYVELRLVTQALGYEYDYEKPNIDNGFNYVVNLKRKTQAQNNGAFSFVRMNTDIVTPNYNSITNVRILINGSSLDLAPKHGYPFIDGQGNAMIPLRVICEKLGHKLGWDQITQTATIDGKYSITIGRNTVRTENESIIMDGKAITKDGKTYVPLELINEVLGYEIDYREPIQGNRYTHLINIIKKDMVVRSLNPPIREGNTYKIITESGIIELNLDTDIDRYGAVNEEKAEELLAGFYDSIKLTINGDNINIIMYKPELPTDIGMDYSASLSAIMKPGRGYGPDMGFWSTGGPSPFVTLRDDDYMEIDFNEISISDIEYIMFSGRINHKGATSIRYIAILNNNKRAVGENAYLFD